MNRTDRLMAYLVMFQSRDLVRARDLATRFEISERTVYRDIDALCQVGVPIYGVAGEGYRLMDGYYLPPVTFSPEEARALALALALLMGFSVRGKTQASAETAHDKIRAILPNRQKREVEALQTVLDFYAFPQPEIDFDDRQFVTFQQAIHDRKLLRLTYHSFGGNRRTERVVEPISLVLLNRAWILSAYCRLRDDLRHFNLERIDAYRVLNESFADRGLKPGPFRRKTFEIRVRFEHEIVRWVREQQHFSFDREEQATDAGIVMVYSVSEWERIETWLLGWGDKMAILAPHHLRERVAETARRMAAKHQID